MSTLVGATEPTFGDQLRDDAVAQVIAHSSNDPWRIAAVKGIAHLAASGRVFEAYELIVLQLCPEPAHPSRWGALFNLCANHGLIDHVGYGPSSRPTVKSSAVKFWRGAP